MKKLLIWGAGDQGTVTLDCALAMNAYDSISFLSFAERGAREIPNYIIYREQDVDLRTFLPSFDEVIVATGDNALREQKVSILNALGIPLATIVHPTAYISPFAQVSAGCTVLAFAVVHINASVGTGCIVNTGAIVEHDCVLGDFVNVCPRVAMAGHTTVGKKAFLGIGCTIINNLSVGEEAVIGAGAVVIRDVPAHEVVAGVPAKRIQS